MPRPDKPINSRGRLDDPMSPSRAVRWTKHGGPESLEGYRGAPSPIEIEVDDVTIIDPGPDIGEPSKWEQRGTSAHIPTTEAQPAVQRRKEWVVVRTVEGRTYRRTDALTAVEEPSEG